MKIAIIGSGISGMMTAWMLGDSVDEIIIIDRKQPGLESSWAGGGIVSPLYPWRYADSVTYLAKASQAIYPDLTEQIHSESGIDPEFLRNGLMIFAPEEQEAALSWASRWAMNLEVADSPKIATLEPQLNQPENSALWFPDVAQLRNPRIVKALYAALQKRRNIRFVLDEPVKRVVHDSGKATALETDRQLLEFDKAVLCAGAWSRLLMEHETVRPDIKPVRGQMLLFRTEPGTVKRITLHDNHYTIPRKDGRVLFGSTIEDTGFIKETTDVARQELLELAAGLYPVLADAPIEHHWAGLRPGSPEGIPYIGACTGLENLYINAGHFRNGVVLAPASAKLVADLVLGNKPDIDPAPYALEAARETVHDLAPEKPM